MVVVANGRGDRVRSGEDTWYLRIMPTSLVLGKEPEELDLWLQSCSKTKKIVFIEVLNYSFTYSVEYVVYTILLQPFFSRPFRVTILMEGGGDNTFAPNWLLWVLLGFSL